MTPTIATARDGRKKNAKKRRKKREKARGSRPARKELDYDHPKCESCNAACCRYIALEIDEPEDAEDIDNMRWYLAHQKVSIYIQDDQWHLCVDVRCKYLDSDDRCTIHADRPNVCREHSPEECEFQNEEFELEQEFRSWDALKAYLEEEGYL